MPNVWESLKREGIVALPIAGSPTIYEGQSDPETKVVVDFNLVSLGTALNSYRFARRLDDKERDLKRAKILFETALSAQKIEGVKSAEALNRYGYLLIRLGNYSRAALVLMSAREVLEQTPRDYDSRIKGVVYGNLGSALEQAGSKEDAMKYYKIGAKYDNPTAKKNSSRLERELGLSK